MTEKQPLARWAFLYRFLEDWVAKLLISQLSITREQASGIVLERCAKALKDHGFRSSEEDVLRTVREQNRRRKFGLRP